MPVPSYQDLITPSSTANGLISESLEERVTSLLAMLAAGKAPDGTVISIGAGGAFTSVTGADPTGTTDSTTAIQTAINTAAAGGRYSGLTTPGSTVLIGPGFYNIGGTNASPTGVGLVLPQGVTLQGAGTGCTLLHLVNGNTGTNVVTGGSCDSFGNVFNSFAAYNKQNPIAASSTCTATISGTTVTVTVTSPAFTVNATGGTLANGMLVTFGGTSGTGTLPTAFTNLAYQISNVNVGAQTFQFTVAAGFSGTVTSTLMFVVPGAMGSQINDLTIDGNGGNQTSPSWGWQLFAQGWFSRNLTISGGRSGCLFSEGSSDNGTFRWASSYSAQMYNLNCQTSAVGPGIQFCGPHDSRMFGGGSSSCAGTGILVGDTTVAGTTYANKGNGFTMDNVHNAGDATSGTGNELYIGVGQQGIKANNCQYESNAAIRNAGTGISLYQVLVDGNGFQMIGGSIYDAGTGTKGNGIQIGNNAAVSGCFIRDTLFGTYLGTGILNAFNFANDAGDNFIDCQSFNVSSAWISGGAPALATAAGQHGTHFKLRGPENPNNTTSLTTTYSTNGLIDSAIYPVGTNTGATATNPWGSPISASTGAITNNLGVDVLVYVTGAGTGTSTVTSVVITAAAGGGTALVPQSVGVVSGSGATGIWGPYLWPSRRTINITVNTTNETYTWMLVGI